MKRKSTTPVAPSQRPRRSVQNQVSANTPSKSMPNTRKSYAKKEIVTSEIAHAEDIQDKSNDKPIDPENNASKSNIGRSIKPNNNNNNNSKDKSSGSPTRRNRRSLKRKQIVESEDSNDNCESGGDETEGNLSESDDTSYTNEIRKPNKRAKPKRKSGRRIVSESEESEEMYDLTEDDDEELSRSKTIAMSSERPKRQRKSRVNLEQSEEEVLEEITDTPKPQTRRRGRPKKTQLNETEISDEISSTRDSSTKTSTPKTRPGRSKINDEEKGSEKKKRGRKSTTKVVEEDLENPGEDDDPDSSVGNDMVICQVCQQEMTSKVFMKKHKKLHHDLCWTQHQEPIDIYNPQLVLDILGAKRKQLQVATGRRYQIALSFECFFCKLVKKSELGYYSHLLVCHRSDEEIEKANKQCDKCEKTIFLPHYHAHQLKHIKEEAVEQEPVVEKRSTSPGPDGKRSAACRAASKITNITKNLLDVETTEGKRKKNEDMEFEIEDDAEEEEDDCSGNSDNESGQENDNISEEEKYLKKEPTSSDNEENYTFDSDFSIGASAGSHTISSAYSPVLDLQHSYEMQKSIYSSVPLYEELQVPRFEFLEESIAKKYLPVTKKSMVIKYPQRTKHFQLNLFSSEVVGDRCVLFCGGPVWTMDWCPHLFSQARWVD
ncbi:transcriptional regulator ATRX homolog isoform X1 [Diaphorina citri]|uniref:Transcriptional regulator ATRX homolog isoform X1 n=1 Tax=Diaphorina citri TaxID=121845 RepID=A0A3Q0J877_DIACI|nr:transcriptional regulator ATRX homolog isoform X1 [Diaphorina citri]XP_026684675.1 transcriptional regulator ATRX homolog isoform X1 [Diaphorina citri]XP_026684681.1 transcriptional regulator ATRX homolog isoform X1 [Diaphorina citri]XP_026684686.1 transcriptional regulator ATRX homolog isoform X1 [Diaphorina citri]KAI5711495.1 hypothetical protein M8J75_000834 [Diaphorina citri]